MRGGVGGDMGKEGGKMVEKVGRGSKSEEKSYTREGQ